MKHPKTPRIPTTMVGFNLDLDLYRQARQIAELSERSLSYVLRAAIRRGLESTPESAYPYIEIDGQRFY